MCYLFLFLLQTLDLHTVKEEDLDFTSKFEIIGTEDGAIVDALVVWFDCLFESEKKNGNTREGVDNNVICLSTSPHKPVTHWYSTVLLLPQKWKLNKGERIAIELNAARCEENVREYTIFVVLTDDKGKEMKQFYNLNDCNPNK